MTGTFAQFACRLSSWCQLPREVEQPCALFGCVAHEHDRVRVAEHAHASLREHDLARDGQDLHAHRPIVEVARRELEPIEEERPAAGDLGWLRGLLSLSLALSSAWRGAMLVDFPAVARPSYTTRKTISPRFVSKVAIAVFARSVTEQRGGRPARRAQRPRLKLFSTASSSLRARPRLAFDRSSTT